MVEIGTYQHYKGGQYKVLLNAVDEASGEKVVVYEALYNNSVSKFWVRSEKVFSELIEINGQLVPRFKKIN